VTVALIVANTIVWIWEWKTGVNKEVLQYGYYPCSLEGPCRAPASLVSHVSWYEGAFSSMFMHGSWLHIGGNMLFLWIFGNNVEDSMGKVRFFLWYLAAGLAATAVQTFVTLQFASSADASIPNIGASGAIAGVLGAYLAGAGPDGVLRDPDLPARDSGHPLPRGLVRVPALGRRLGDPPSPGGRGRRVLRARRGLRLRGRDGVRGCDATAVTAALVSAGLLTDIALGAGALGLLVVLIYLFSGD